jgi:hypothetical protein
MVLYNSIRYPPTRFGGKKSGRKTSRRPETSIDLEDVKNVLAKSLKVQQQRVVKQPHIERLGNMTLRKNRDELVVKMKDLQPEYRQALVQFLQKNPTRKQHVSQIKSHHTSS